MQLSHRVKVTDKDIDALWEKARVATDKFGDDYANGVFDTLQYLLGNGNEPDLSDE